MSNSPKKIRLMLVDDHEVVRIGLKAILGSYDDFEVIGEASGAEHCMRVIREVSPDVLLLDLRLGDGNGCEVCRRIREEEIDVRVLILSSFLNESIVIEAVNAGAEGYVLKNADSESLVAAIRQVSEGKSVFDPEVIVRVFSSMGASHDKNGDPKEKIHSLSQQELKVLRLVAQGSTNREIAQSMELSEKTIKNYLRNLMNKLEVNRRAEAAAFYVKHIESRRDADSFADFV
jgi:two-component system, NarL family, response regulator DevR